jgi:CRISPR-associated protein Cas5d
MTIHLKTWGDLACFTRPEMKVERVSYAVITPSAARGLLEAILYKPQFRWRISRSGNRGADLKHNRKEPEPQQVTAAEKSAVAPRRRDCRSEIVIPIPISSQCF